MRQREVRSFVLAVTVLAVVAVDQYSKRVAFSTMAPGQVHDVVPDLLSLTLVQNFNGGYGLLASATWVVIAVSAVVLVLFATAFRELISRSPVAGFAFGLVTGGACGNIIDRLHYGFVVDFVTMPPIPILEVFNLADLCIVAGVPLLIVANLMDEKA